VSRTTQMLLCVAVVAGAAAAYWYLALAPKRDEVAALDTKITTTQATVQQAEATANNYEAARKAYRQNYATVVRLGKAVPADDDVRSLMVQIDSSAKSSKIDFSTISLTGVGSTDDAAAKPTTSFVTVPFSFTFEGNFFRLSDFFSHLDSFVRVKGDDVDVTGRLLHIDTFALTPKAVGSRQLTAQIGVTSYQLPESEGLTAGATAQGPAASGAASTPSAGGTSSGTTPPTTTATAGVTG
jgi:Tfp pilus assembly protein PilO